MTAVSERKINHAHLGQIVWLSGGALLLLAGFFMPVGPETVYSTWVGIMVSLCFGLSAWHIWRSLHRSNKEQAGQWAYLAALLVLFAFDKQVGLHEWLKKPLQDLFGLSYDFSSIWFLPFILLAPFWLWPVYKLYRAQHFIFRRSFRLAVLVYGLGALGIDVLQSFYASIFGKEGSGLQALNLSEEVLELSGAMLVHQLFRKGVPENDGGR